MWYEVCWLVGLQGLFEFVLQQEGWVGDVVMYFQVIFECYLLDCFGVGFVVMFEGGECFGEGVLLEQVFGKGDVVFECVVYVLVVEGNYCMGGIVEQYGVVLQVLMCEVQGVEQVGGMFFLVVVQVWDQWQCVGEVVCEQGFGLGVGGGGGEVGVVGVGQEQGDGEGVFVIGQGDVYVMVVWLDVQCVGFDVEVVVWVWWNFQFFVGVVEEFDVFVQWLFVVYCCVQG